MSPDTPGFAIVFEIHDDDTGELKRVETGWMHPPPTSPVYEGEARYRRDRTRNAIRDGILARHRRGPGRTIAPVEVTVYPNGGRDRSKKQWFDVYVVKYADGSERRYSVLAAE